MRFRGDGEPPLRVKFFPTAGKRGTIEHEVYIAYLNQVNVGVTSNVASIVRALVSIN